MRCEIERIQATILALMYGGHSCPSVRRSSYQGPLVRVSALCKTKPEKNLHSSPAGKTNFEKLLLLVQLDIVADVDIFQRKHDHAGSGSRSSA